MLREKIEDLFNYRMFPELIQHGQLTESEYQQLWEQLVDLQTAIYYLDHHLETNWEVDHQKIKKCWDEIYTKLTPFGLSEKEKYNLCAHIRKYQKHELELREHLLPTRFKMEFFYFYKSCDVKLLRSLIYKRIPALKKEATIGDWRYFDLITEVNDDVEDVIEDTTTINGNCFLIGLLTEDKEAVIDKFRLFLQYAFQSSEERFCNDDTSLQKAIRGLTAKEFEHTSKEIVKQAQQLIQTDSSRIKILPYLTFDKGHRIHA